MPIFRTNLYDQILSDIKVLHQFNDDQLKDYLVDLQELASQVYLDLQNDVVTVDYSDPEVQTAYILRYFQGYWEQFNRALWMIKESHEDFIFSHPALNIGLFGCGPCPEIIGGIRFFEDTRDFLPKEIKFHLYDKKTNEWEFALKNFIFPRHRQNDLINFGVYIGSEQADFTKSFSLAERFSKDFYHVCSFQNCLNEFTEFCSDEMLEKNINTVIDSLVPGGFLVMTDRKKTLPIAQRLEELISSRLEPVDQIVGSFDSNSSSPMPEVLENLFTGEGQRRLIATRHNKRFIWVFRKHILE